MLLSVLQIVVRGMVYVFIAWNRFAPDAGSLGARWASRPDGSSNQAKRGG